MKIGDMRTTRRNNRKVICKILLMLILCVVLGACATKSIQKDGLVEYVGAQKNMFETGKAEGVLNLKFFQGKDNVYAVGPAALLHGEMTILNSKAYVSKVRGDDYHVDNTLNHDALFLVWSQVPRWKAIPVPESVNTYVQLQKFVKDQAAASGMDVSKPIPFQFTGAPVEIVWHINCDKTESKPITRELFAKSKAIYTMKNEPVDIIGFYSERHNGIFISQYAPAIKPDSGDKNAVHMHLVSRTTKATGHIDNIILGKGMTLRLPEK
jgi:acetolactate decarboxylase